MSMTLTTSRGPRNDHGVDETAANKVEKRNLGETKLSFAQRITPESPTSQANIDFCIPPTRNVNVDLDRKPAAPPKKEAQQRYVPEVIEVIDGSINSENAFSTKDELIEMIQVVGPSDWQQARPDRNGRLRAGN